MRRVHGRWAMVVGVALLATAGLAVVASPAAAIAGYERIGENSPLDSNNKDFDVDCPGSTVVVGGSGYLVAAAPSAAGRVGFAALTPLADGSGYHVVAREADVNFATSWRAVGVAICATEPAGYEFDEDASSNGSGSTRSASVSCPSNTTRVLSAGAYLTGGGSGRVFIDEIVPTATSVTVHASETQAGTASNWQVHATVVCANEPAGYEVVESATPAADSDSSYSTQAVCSAGKQMLSAGFAINDGDGEVLLNAINIIDSDAPSTRAGIGAHEDADGFGGNWSVTKFRVCVT